MSDDLAGQLVRWRHLQQQAENGELRIDPGVAERLADHCDTLIIELEAIKQEAWSVTSLSGFGGLQSAKDLQRKFEQKAHDYIAVLDQHIQVVTAMRDTYLTTIHRLTEQDQLTSANLHGITPTGGW